MKIITWNINGYRSIAGQNPSRRYDIVTKDNKLFEFIDAEKPDILCLQETKADLEQIDESIRTPPGYHSIYNSCKIKKGYSGVALFSKIKPKSIRSGIGLTEFDNEGRIIEADFDDFVVFSVYFPKGYTDHERLDYKMRFYDAFFNYTDKLRKKGRKIIISGDYNTAHKEIDLARPKENVNISGFLPEERKKLDEIVKSGYIDSFRILDSSPGIYSWWTQRGRARENNIGWRIDYHFVTKNLLTVVQNVKYRPEILGSDHCPVILELNI